MLAYTESDGPGRPPVASPTWMVGTLIGVLGATFFGVISTDALCQDHRVLVEGLATVAMGCLVVALVGLWRGWASAPTISLAASVLGVSMGLIDAIHSPTRGALVAIGFGAAATLAAFATVRSFQLGRWERDARARVPRSRRTNPPWRRRRASS
jgi:integral membrane sensor domain MASE1